MTTHCPYCGMAGVIIKLAPASIEDHPDAEVLALIDWHQYECGTKLYADSQTAEVYEDRGAQSPGCREIARLKAEVDAMTNNWQRVVAARDGERHGDEPY